MITDPRTNFRHIRKCYTKEQLTTKQATKYIRPAACPNWPPLQIIAKKHTQCTTVFESVGAWIKDKRKEYLVIPVISSPSATLG